MRPIEKGSHPKDDSNQDVLFQKYQQAHPELISRLGEFCSYCEMRLEAGLAVEHVQPKTLYPQLALHWDNFLLACPHCNPTKGHKDVQLADYVWPDLDDTHMIFAYLEDGRVKAVDSPYHARATNLINLVGLNKNPTPSESNDRRLHNRRLNFELAKRYRDSFASRPTDDLHVDLLVTAAQKSGYWSIWYTVFRDYPEIIRRFNESFPGTSPHCFETDTYQAKSRHNRP
ncbi:HNH endonuclease [Tumebacillus sp. ITR2]|uniref:HNH endonuclease n=1 Tax=Tumebacillus amylolyticus TaxID=2801339 RepID=A0ABS1J8Y7_9BACL|nr:HNH endonuclease [Tumebacillus amylolyticus]MBL0386714.1 HNH endonuclease [Tumebacillus amylolyticus]